MRGKTLGPRAIAAGLSLVPSQALAEVCDKARPMWTPGTSPTIFSEALALAITPPSLVLFLVTLACLRFRWQWVSLGMVLLWSVWVSVLAFLPPNATQQQAIAEGCIGSPALFIGIIAALCVALVLWTAPREARE